MKFKIALIFWMIVIKASANAHLTALEPADTSTFIFFPKTYGEKKWKVLVGLDARRSFFQGQKVKIDGLRIGAQFRGVHRFGLGTYSLSQKIILEDVFINEIDAQTPTNLRVNLQFTTIFYERVLFKIPKWEIALTGYLGGGNISNEYINNLGNYTTQSKTDFTVIGSGVNVKYYIFSWLVPRLSFGHRLTFNKNKDVMEALNKPFYAFGLSINPINLYREIFKKEKKDI